MKKKVLFMVINMNIGGTEKALLNMINEMPKDQYDITILMLEEYGGFLNYIPDWVNIKCFKDYKNVKGIINNPPLQTIKEAFIFKQVLYAFQLLVLNLYSKFTNERSVLYKYLLRNHPIDQNEYDVAIAYAGPMDFISYFVMEKVKAKKKIQWIHFDVNKIGFNKKFATKLYQRFDKVYVVSNEAKRKVVEKLPMLKERTECFNNIISSKNIINMSEQDGGFEDNFNGIRILTVARLSEEKGQDITIPILAKLIKEGINVKWFCIGEGKKRKSYMDLIKKYGVEEHYILLGSKINPYVYMKECDIYVQSSRHEGYCITLAEARCLKKPIISTKFTGVEEHIQNGKTGIVVSNKDELYKAIKLLINNEDLRNKLSKNLIDEQVNNFSSKKIDKRIINL